MYHHYRENRLDPRYLGSCHPFRVEPRSHFFARFFFLFSMGSIMQRVGVPFSLNKHAYTLASITLSFSVLPPFSRSDSIQRRSCNNRPLPSSLGHGVVKRFTRACALYETFFQRRKKRERCYIEGERPATKRVCKSRLHSCMHMNSHNGASVSWR